MTVLTFYQIATERNAPQRIVVVGIRRRLASVRSRCDDGPGRQNFPNGTFLLYVLLSGFDWLVGVGGGFVLGGEDFVDSGELEPVREEHDDLVIFDVGLPQTIDQSDM